MGIGKIELKARVGTARICLKGRILINQVKVVVDIDGAEKITGCGSQGGEAVGVNESIGKKVIVKGIGFWLIWIIDYVDKTVAVDPDVGITV